MCVRATIAREFTVEVQKRTLEAFDDVCDLVATMVTRAFITILDASPPASLNDGEGGITVPTRKIDLLADLGLVVEGVMAACLDDEIFRHELFPRLRQRIDYNLIAVSGGNPHDPGAFKRAPTMPTKSDIADKAQLVEAYLGGTPFISLFEGVLPFTIPTAARFEHHHIVAGSGHGKTQTLQYLIGNDLDAVERGEASVVVLDSQGDLIKTISQLNMQTQRLLGQQSTAGAWRGFARQT